MLLLSLFKVFLWKNWLLIRCNSKSLLCIFIGCVTVLSCYLWSTKNPISTPDIIYDSKYSDILKNYFPGNEGDYLFYAPDTPHFNALMEDVRQELQLSFENLKPFANASDIFSNLENQCKGICFAVKFDSKEHDTTLSYSISSNIVRVSPHKRFINDEVVSGIKDDDEYIRSGFLTLQHLIDKNYIKSKTGSENNINDYQIEISSMPGIAIEYMDSYRFIHFGAMYSIIFCVLLLATFVVPLVEEKQDGLKEFLVIATPYNFLNGLTFFLVRFLFYVLFLCITLIIASSCRALGIISIFYVVVLFILYMLSTMSYAYLISVCFHKVFYAKVGGLLLLIIPYIFYLVTGGLSTMATYLFSTKTFMDGIQILQIFTNKHHNFNAEDLFNNITDESFKLMHIYALLIFQCILYSTLYNYLSCIYPGPGGLKRPYGFFIDMLFGKKKPRNQYTTSERGTDAIIIQDLVKKFKTPKREINIADRLNMVIKNKEITVLLGHNGVGKTTTLNMIMGSEPKDSGKIIVCSERDVSSYRHLIGFCPQHSVFMQYMTCAQHLEFFAQLRGLSRHKAQDLANNLLRELRLVAKANEFGKNLSGGMKRRLSLGIALAGDTKIVILDEPSSGLDIESRRELWDVLLEIRKRKAVLITTHHMEEAEVLGDTICLLSNGCLQRTGSPMELKRKVGTGYILKLCTNDNFSEEKTMNLIQQSMPTAKILTVVPPTVHISLPYRDKDKYSSTLLQLENETKQQELGIKSISICDTSMEDVFLNCANEIDQVDSVTINETARVPYQRLNMPTRIPKIRQFMAVAYKKCLFMRSEWIYTLLMFLLPFISILLAIIFMRSNTTENSEDRLPLNLQHIKSGVIYICSPSEDNYYGNAIANNLKMLVNQHQHHVKAEKLNLGQDNNVTKELLHMQREDLAHFLQNVIGVIDLRNANQNDDNNLRIYFSGNIYHSSVILLNLVENAVLKYKTNEVQNQIETTYAPIRKFITHVSPTRLEYYAVIVPIGFFFYMFYFVSLPFQENVSGFKNLQAIPRFTYWSSVWICDVITHAVVCLILFGLQLLLMPAELYTLQEQIYIIACIFLYGCTYLPILYCFANGFRSISTVSTYLLSMLIISAILPLITSGGVRAMNDYETTINLLSVLPDFNLNHKLRIINENFMMNRSKALMSSNISMFQFNAIAIFVGVIVMYLFIKLFENKYNCGKLREFFLCYHCRQVKTGGAFRVGEEERLADENMQKEVKEILRSDKQNIADYPLIVSDLYKVYDRKPVVCGLNFFVQKKECFGLLGVNGAGKTSTFQMITTNTTITAGTIQIDGVDIVDNETEYKYRFGYCPQNDCLNNFMTAYQTLKYMALLRGLDKQSTHEEIMYWLEELNLLKYKNTEVRHYSGGTKRKLNAALAMIGSPSLVLLDEPTTGVDPASRRFLWKCIKDFQERSKTVVLTSHSMDECEQLCNRLAIMADGKFKCLGAVPELKELYGAGFTLKVKIKENISDLNVEEIVEDITVQIRQQFPDAELRENHAGTLTFFISKRIAWSNVFKRTEQFAHDCAELVADYSVNESTLEDIFLRCDTKNERHQPPTNVEEV